MTVTFRLSRQTRTPKLSKPAVTRAAMMVHRDSMLRRDGQLPSHVDWKFKLKEFDKTGRDKSELYYEKKKNAVLMDKMIDTCLEKRKAYQLVRKLRRL